VEVKLGPDSKCGEGHLATAIKFYVTASVPVESARRRSLDKAFLSNAELKIPLLSEDIRMDGHVLTLNTELDRQWAELHNLACAETERKRNPPGPASTVPTPRQRLIVVDCVFECPAVAYLAIDRESGKTVHSRNRRAVKGESRGPEPLLGYLVLPRQVE
jgi:hypothetical protein